MIERRKPVTINKALAGYCGLYCGACDIFRLYKRGQQTGKPATWDDLPERFKKHLPIKQKSFVCEGCRSDAVFSGCSICPLRACARKKGDVELCVECKKYPCLRMKILKLVAGLFSLEKKLPHQYMRKDNLERIRDAGLEAWLSEQERQWRCPKCQTPYSWYQSACDSCGTELDSLKGFLVKG